MKNRASLSLLVAALALFASAPAIADAHIDETENIETAEVVLPAGPEGPALWKVADEDTTIYLFGTVHLLPPETQWYDAEIAEALSSADVIVTELAMDPESEAAMQEISMERGMFSDGTTLRSILDEEQIARYEAALGGLGVPPGAFDEFEPWLAGLTLTMLPLLQQGYDLDSGVDKVIRERAGEQKAFEALETAEFQLSLFDGLPTDKQVEFLMEAVDDIPDAKTTLDAMVAEWVEGDAKGLAEVMNENLDDPELAEALLYTRNANWAEWIANRLDEPGTVFIAVGAGHLAGMRSVQDYLAEREIKSERVQ